MRARPRFLGTVRRLAPIARIAACVLSVAIPRSASAQGFRTFSVKSYMGRCLDYGPAPQAGGAVFIDNCSGLSEQRVGVEEFGPPVGEPSPSPSIIVAPRPPSAHQVRLHAANLCIAVAGGKPSAGAAMTLASCDFSANQIFLLDGDSIILDADRGLVVQLRQGDTRAKEPLALDNRGFNDFEFWDFFASDGSGRAPTSTFVTVSNATALQSALASAGPNSVITVTDDVAFTALKNALQIPGGVTLRGNRRDLLLGPQLSLSVTSGVVPVSSPGNTGYTGFIEILGPNTRISNLRIRGPSRADCKHDSDPVCSQHGVAGIIVKLADDSEKLTIDHNDLSDWTRAAIDLYSWLGEPTPPPCGEPLYQARNVVIARNFIHDNRQRSNNPPGGHSDADGYGVAAGWGSHPLIAGNTFLDNVHSVTSDGTPYAGYSVVDSLFESPGSFTDGSANIDMHGSGPSHDGGVGGSGVEVLRNTFFDATNQNFSMRGFPCSGGVDVFRGNVVLQNVDGSIHWEDGGPPPPYLKIDSRFFAPLPSASPPAPTPTQPSPSVQCLPPTTITRYYCPPLFSLSDPTLQFAVGDFDGDGKDDLFMATGSGWYYSSGANAEWRFLSAKTETLNNLLFGDFDGDGRTDVFTVLGDRWMVSWGGRSPWQLLSERKGDWAPPSTGTGSHSILDFAIGDFIGVGHDDVFYADGVNWYVSDGGVGPFVLYANSSFKVQDLAFGHFDPAHVKDPKTDIVGVVAGKWMASFAHGDHAWTPLRSALTNTMAGLVVGDFNGDGLDDVASLVSGKWQVSYGGTGDWKPLYSGSGYIAAGRFDPSRKIGSDIVIWFGEAFDIVSAGTGAPKQQSRQNMR